MTRRYLLDTGPAFDFLFKRKGIDIRVEEARRNGAKIGICMPGFGEIVAGLEASDSREKSWAIAEGVVLADWASVSLFTGSASHPGSRMEDLARHESRHRW